MRADRARACSNGEDTAVSRRAQERRRSVRGCRSPTTNTCFSAQADALSATLSEVESVVALTGQAFAKCLRRSRDRSGRRSPYSDENRPVRIPSERSRSSRGCHLRHGQGGKLHAYAGGAIRFDTEVGRRSLAKPIQAGSLAPSARQAIPTSFRRRPPADCCSTRSAAPH